MKNFKITNLKSKVVYLLNEKEKENFFTKNAYQKNGYVQYDIIDLTRQRKESKIKFYNNILFTLGSFIVFYILIFAMCYTFSFIDSLIF